MELWFVDGLFFYFFPGLFNIYYLLQYFFHHSKGDFYAKGIKSEFSLPHPDPIFIMGLED